MSAIGTKRTWLANRLMSAIGGKADIMFKGLMSANDPKRTWPSSWVPTAHFHRIQINFTDQVVQAQFAAAYRKV
jgi:hypothetical protein